MSAGDEKIDGAVIEQFEELDAVRRQLQRVVGRAGAVEEHQGETKYGQRK